MSKHYLFWLERLVGATASVYSFVHTGLSALIFGAAFLTLLIAYLPFILYPGILRVRAADLRIALAAIAVCIVDLIHEGETSKWH